jgi:YggT family protein
MIYLINTVQFIIQLLELAIIVHVILSYFMSPYHPIRETLSRFIEPLLTPIRRVVPSIGGLDFSPLILLLLIQILGQVLVMILRSLF